MTNKELAAMWGELIHHAPADAGPLELEITAMLNEPITETIARLLNEPEHEIEF